MQSLPGPTREGEGTSVGTGSPLLAQISFGEGISQLARGNPHVEPVIQVAIGCGPILLLGDMDKKEASIC
jgi:hypothetical protein